ncbi:MAG: ThuA domain-containing protein [Lentisphaerales bacterium]|nr:ThuA domain-containing protein [Lentisphaerales bacterium]
MGIQKLLFIAILVMGLSAFANEEVKAIRAKMRVMKEEVATLKKAKRIKESRALNKQWIALNHKALWLENNEQIKADIKAMDIQKPKKPRKVLIYSKTTGFRHTSIEFGAKVLTFLGEQSGAFTATHTEDAEMINHTELTKYDTIIMLNTTNNPIAKPEQRSAFEKFLASKKGLVGIHAATDCHKNWPEYLEAMGGIFDGHPWGAGAKVTLYNEDLDHPCCKHVPQGYVIRDEIYQYKDDKHFTRDKMRVLLSLDLNGPNMQKKNMKRKDNDYPVSWIRSYTGSRVFYTNLGHNETTFVDKVALQHMLSGIQYALGDLEADATPSAKIGKLPKAVK